jgi:hypothetical protein
MMASIFFMRAPSRGQAAVLVNRLAGLVPVFAEKKRRRFRILPPVEKSAAKMSPTSGQTACLIGGVFAPGCLCFVRR